MAKFRYVGDAKEGKNLSLSGGFIHFPKGKWVDLTAEAEAANISPHHAELAALSLAETDGWEVETKKTRKHTEPAGPDEENTT